MGCGSGPILADGPLATTPPVRAGLMRAGAPFRSGQSQVADQDGCRSSSASPAMFNCQPPSLILQPADIAAPLPFDCYRAC